MKKERLSTLFQLLTLFLLGAFIGMIIYANAEYARAQQPLDTAWNCWCRCKCEGLICDCSSRCYCPGKHKQPPVIIVPTPEDTTEPTLPEFPPYTASPIFQITPYPIETIEPYPGGLP